MRVPCGGGRLVGGAEKSVILPAAEADHRGLLSAATRARCARTQRCASMHQCFLMLYQTSAAHSTCPAASAGNDDVSRLSPGTYALIQSRTAGSAASEAVMGTMTWL